MSRLLPAALVMVLTLAAACQAVPAATPTTTASPPPTPVTPTVPAEAPGDIPWPEAEALILGGQVQAVSQFHSLKVTLTLADGRTLTTVEPAIDEVFRVLEACGQPCASIAVATE